MTKSIYKYVAVAPLFGSSALAQSWADSLVSTVTDPTLTPAQVMSVISSSGAVMNYTQNIEGWSCRGMLNKFDPLKNEWATPSVGPVMGNPDTGYSVTISFELTRTYGTVVTTCPP